jgi:glutaredoxin
MTTVILYTRAGCHLCEQAREILIRARARHAFELEERDIEADDRLLAAYLERIPVVSIDGVEAFELFVDEPELERMLGRVGIR